MLKKCICYPFFSCVLAGAVGAGELTEATFDTSPGWKSTRCSKPTKLFFHVTDIDSYNEAVEEYNDYLLQVRTYRVCIGDEAQTDARTAAQSIANGLDRLYDQIRAELESARSELESAKESLQ
jgi:hypothetical protein